MSTVTLATELLYVQPDELTVRRVYLAYSTVSVAQSLYGG